MANVTIAGNSYVITSTKSLEDLKTIQKYRPAALTITDPETKEVLFRVGIGTDSLNDYGVSFGGVSNDEEKLASLTLPIPEDEEDAKEYVTDKVGTPLINLNKIEARIVETLEDIKLEREVIAESIKISV